MIWVIGSPLSLAAEAGKAMAGVQSLDITRSDQRLHLLLGETATPEAPPGLSHLWSEDNGVTWSKPLRVDLDNKPAIELRRGEDAQIAAFGDHLVASWVMAAPDSAKGGVIATALSSDRGQTWKRGPNPDADAPATSHTYIDMAVDGKATYHLVWVAAQEGGSSSLRTATSTDYGITWSPARTLAGQTCEKSWNRVAASLDKGAWVIHRQKPSSDMAVAALHDGARKEVTVGGFGWSPQDCPSTGAGLSIAPDGGLHAAVWTGKEKMSGVYYLNSSDQGLTWTEPLLLGENYSTNPDCAAGDKNTVAAVWNAPTKHALTVKAAFSKDGGRHWSGAKTLSPRDASATHPRVIATVLGFRVFWTEVDGSLLTWKSVPFEVLE
ncbi:MAG: sialidase [Verrucomicrobiaceae bacterium]|nr:sialidase [Verrucomicrobiaceae bacterium]